MSTHIEIFVLCNLIVEGLDEDNFNDLSFNMNIKTKHNEIDFFERENKRSYKNRRNEKRTSKRYKCKNKKNCHVNKFDC